MGVSAGSTDARRPEVGGPAILHKRAPQVRVVALAGNPNVGKSTVFNGLTGLKQHTGRFIFD